MPLNATTHQGQFAYTAVATDHTTPVWQELLAVMETDDSLKREGADVPLRNVDFVGVETGRIQGELTLKFTSFASDTQRLFVRDAFLNDTSFSIVDSTGPLTDPGHDFVIYRVKVTEYKDPRKGEGPNEVEAKLAFYRPDLFLFEAGTTS